MSGVSIRDSSIKISSYSATNVLCPYCYYSYNITEDTEVLELNYLTLTMRSVCPHCNREHHVHTKIMSIGGSDVYYLSDETSNLKSAQLLSLDELLNKIGYKITYKKLFEDGFGFYRGKWLLTDVFSGKETWISDNATLKVSPTLLQVIYNATRIYLVDECIHSTLISALQNKQEKYNTVRKARKYLADYRSPYSIAESLFLMRFFRGKKYSLLHYLNNLINIFKEEYLNREEYLCKQN